MTGSNERKRKAKVAFRKFRQILENKKSLIERSEDAQDWNEVAHQLHDLLNEFGPELPDDIKHELDNIANVTDTSPEKVLETYTSLDKTVAQAIGSINVGLSTPAIIGIVIGVIVAAGAGTAGVLLTSTITIDIINTGCSAMDLSQLPSSPLLQYTDQTINSSERGQIRFSSVLNPQIDVGKKTLETQGVGSFAFPADTDEIWYNENVILQKAYLDRDGSIEIVCK